MQDHCITDHAGKYDHGVSWCTDALMHVVTLGSTTHLFLHTAKCVVWHKKTNGAGVFMHTYPADVCFSSVVSMGQSQCLFVFLTLVNCSRLQIITLLFKTCQQDFASACPVMTLSVKKKKKKQFVSVDERRAIDVCPQWPRSIKLTAVKPRWLNLLLSLNIQSVQLSLKPPMSCHTVSCDAASWYRPRSHLQVSHRVASHHSDHIKPCQTPNFLLKCLRARHWILNSSTGATWPLTSVEETRIKKKKSCHN